MVEHEPRMSVNVDFIPLLVKTFGAAGALKTTNAHVISARHQRESPAR